MPHERKPKDPPEPPAEPDPSDRSHRHAGMAPSLIRPPGFDRFLTQEELIAIPLEELEAARRRAEADPAAEEQASRRASAQINARFGKPPPTP